MLDIAIVLNGNIADPEGFEYLIKSADYIIAVDGGLNYLVELEIRPDLFLGDFDSVNVESLAKVNDWAVQVVKFPKKKNYTDSELAIKRIIADDILARYHPDKPVIGFLAAFGSRYDHMLSNQFLAERFANKADFILSDGLALQWIVQGPKKLKLNWPSLNQERKNKFNFSLLALSKIVENITLTNSEYSLNEYDLQRGHSIGISNLVSQSLSEGKGTRDVEISFSKGSLTIIVVPSI